MVVMGVRGRVPRASLGSGSQTTLGNGVWMPRSLLCRPTQAQPQVPLPRASQHPRWPPDGAGTRTFRSAETQLAALPPSQAAFQENHSFPHSVCLCVPRRPRAGCGRLGQGPGTLGSGQEADLQQGRRGGHRDRRNGDPAEMDSVGGVAFGVTQPQAASGLVVTRDMFLLLGPSSYGELLVPVCQVCADRYAPGGCQPG